MRYLILGLMLVMAAPATAGPILESAKRQRVELAQDEAPAPAYRKGGGRKWAEWLGIVGGGLMTLTVRETCLGNSCITEWAPSVGGPGLAILTASIVSKVLPDPQK